MLKFLVLKKMDYKLCEMIREIDEVLGNEMYQQSQEFDEGSCVVTRAGHMRKIIEAAQASEPEELK